MHPAYDLRMGHEQDMAEKQVERRSLTLQKEIDGVVDQMRHNIQNAGQRGERLDTLQNKTDHLSDQANGFRRGANRVRKQMWWKDMKMRMCIIVGIILLLIVIIVPSGECRPLRGRPCAQPKEILTATQLSRQTNTTSVPSTPTHTNR